MAEALKEAGIETTVKPVALGSERIVMEIRSKGGAKGLQPFATIRVLKQAKQSPDAFMLEGYREAFKHLAAQGK